MKKDNTKDIKFINRPINEFVIFACKYVNRDELFKIINESNIKMEKRLIEIFDYMDENLSPFIKSEIDFFRETVSLTVALYGFVDDFEEINNIDDYYKKFDEATEEQIFNYIGGAFLGEYYKDDNTAWGEVKNSLPLMKEYILNIKDIKKSLKKDIISLYDSPQETIMRLKYVIKALYKLYKNFEDELNNKVVELTGELKREFEKDHEKFFSENFIGDVIDINKDKIKIQISYFSFIGIRIFRKSDNEMWAIIGYKSTEYYRMMKLNDNLDKFLKLISDKTRQRILKLISEEERYNQSLAKELNLTPATVNYHLQNFLLIGLISVREDNNKVYYKLNKEVANKYIEQLRERLNL